MNVHLENIKQLLQDATLPEDKKQILLKAITDADKQWSITDFKLDRTEKVKRQQLFFSFLGLPTFCFSAAADRNDGRLATLNK